MDELPLVFFTLFSQAAIGLWTLSLLNHLSVYRSGTLMLPTTLYRTHWVILGLMVLGMGIGMLHMGHPFRFMNVIWGLGRSAMSLEALLSGAFLGLLGLWMLLALFHKNAALMQFIHIIGVAIGLLFAWSIANVYQIDTVKAWASHHTYLQMLFSVAILGGAFAAFLRIKIGGYVAIIAMLTSMAFKIDYIQLITQIMPEQAEAQFVFLSIQCFGLIMGSLLLVYGHYAKATSLVLGLATFIILCAELCGRIVFYNTWAVPM